MTSLRRTNRAARAGFTLVEMMVAMALSLGIMLILTEAFRISIDFVRSANSTGVMMAQLNGVGNTLKQDFQYDFFLPDDSRPNGGLRLSDQKLNVAGTPAPTAGFFFVGNGPPVAATVYDQDNLAVNTAAHSMQFTVVLPGGTDQSLFTLTSSANNVYSSRAAVVTYFLVPSGTSPGGGSQLYTLYRRVRLIAVSTDDQPALAPKGGESAGAGGSYNEVVVAQASSGYATAHTLQSINSATADRSPPSLAYPSYPRLGDDVLASNVLSFEVLPWWDPGAGSPTPRPFSTAGGNTDYPYDSLNNGGAGTANFDTTNSKMRLRSLQITLRVYDPKMKQARQNTWKFAL